MNWTYEANSWYVTGPNGKFSVAQDFSWVSEKINTKAWVTINPHSVGFYLDNDTQVWVNNSITWPTVKKLTAAQEKKMSKEDIRLYEDSKKPVIKYQIQHIDSHGLIADIATDMDNLSDAVGVAVKYIERLKNVKIVPSPAQCLSGWNTDNYDVKAEIDRKAGITPASTPKEKPPTIRKIVKKTKKS